MAVITGGPGADTLVGTAAADTFTGREGDDVIVFSRTGAGHTDVIGDFGAVYLTASLTGSQEVPPNTSSAAGTLTGSVRRGGGALDFFTTTSGLDFGGRTSTTADDVVGGHFHRGGFNVNGAIVWGFIGSPNSDLDGETRVNAAAGTVSGQWDANEGNGLSTLTTELAALLAGNIYINLHTVGIPGGEIRGQVLPVDFGRDRVDLSGLGIGDFETVRALLSDVGGSAQLTTRLDGQTYTLVFQNVTTVNLTASDFIFAPARDDRLSGGANDDDLFGGAGADVISGGGGADRLWGGSGNDLIGGGAGDDFISGGDGDDFVGGEDGNDRISGGAGGDRLFGDAGNDLIGGGEGADGLFGQAGDDFMGGEGGDDFLDGGAGVDVLFGDAGNDVIIGGAGADRVFGQDGNDTVRGDEGDDYLDGNAGNDVLEGNAGMDQLRGGAGADTFFYNAVSDAAPVSTGALEQILDFNQAEGDRINISRIDADTTQAGDQAFTLVSAFSGQRGQAVLTTNADGTTFLALDLDGDRVGDFSVLIFGQVTAQGLVL
jgi:Ca2+-binding RTX toxin-like protein